MTDIACELDPLCLVSNTGAAWVRFVTGDYAEVIDRCRHTIDMAAEFPAPHRLLSAALVQLGDAKAAVRHLDAAPAIHWEPATLAWLAHASAAAGDKPRALGLIDQLEAMSRTQYISRYHLALAWAGAGDLDQAFTKLACACEDRDPALMLLNTDPRFAAVRNDDRYAAVSARLGFDREITVHV